MQARLANASDIEEIVRLAGEMFESLGVDAAHHAWREEGGCQLAARLGEDLHAAVVDHPDDPGRLVASGVGVVLEPLPSPTNVSGRIGYIQWLCVEDGFRRRGLGRAVTSALLAWLEQRGVRSVELYATAAGEPLYRSLGFAETASLAMRRHST